MSILVRTGNGITDLKYVDSATKGLKVLQKTGNKTVQWITTAAGTTYQNILQKRGVKDLFYGSITIPADEPTWAANYSSGSKLKFSGNASYKGVIGTAGIHNSGFGLPKEGFFNVDSSGYLNDYSARVVVSNTTSDIYLDWTTNNDYVNYTFWNKVKKIFFVKNSTEKIVVLVTGVSAEIKSGGDGYYITLKVRNIFNTMKSAGNVTVGIRGSDT